MTMKLLIWLWRAWPILSLFPVIFIHALLIHYFCLNASTTNKIFSYGSQIAGGLLILYSIDSNIGVIKGKTLIEVLVNYIKECPLKKLPLQVEVHDGVNVVAGGKAKVAYCRNPKTIDAKIEYLQEQIKNVKRDLEQESKDLHNKIDLQAKNMGIEIQKTKSTLQTIESRMEKVYVGGIKGQLFGVLLIVYGAFSGYFA